ncbi:hypothetical protein KXZ74_26010, partial [Escherichia coli]|nr:hypothetical protein [Escherichia coli]
DLSPPNACSGHARRDAADPLSGRGDIESPAVSDCDVRISRRQMLVQGTPEGMPQTHYLGGEISNPLPLAT